MLYSSRGLTILPLLLFVALGAAQNEPATLEAYRLQPDEEIILDGQVSESFWSKVQIATNFLQQEPVEGNPASEKTEVRVAYDADNLYISVILFDSDPSGIKGFQRKWDASLATDDRFMWILDTYNDQRNAYFFEINPEGLMGDGLLRTGQGISFNKAWNGIWRAWVKKGAHGWSAEIRIPFRTLNFDPTNDTWGINFQRTVRRKNEELLWTGHRRNQGIFRPQNAGKLTGLHKPSQGIGLEVIPYGISTYSTRGRKQTFEDQLSANGGFDVNYSVTPNLRAGLTFNTDFAETEVDDRQVNLTRFPLFFPERRAFFLEGGSVFNFAPASGPNPYFSRRIGLQGGNPVPILGGGRIIGRVGQSDVGLIHIRTREAADGTPPEDFTVARVVQNVFKESQVGLIYTRRATEGDSLADRHTIGADIEMGTSRFLGNKNLQFQAFMVYHNEALPEVRSTEFWDRTVRGARLNFPNQPWSGHVSYREFGEAYDPAVGFAPRVAFRRLQPTVTYSPLISKSKVIRELTWEYNFEYLMELDFRPATVNHRITLLGFRFETGDFFRILFTHNFEYLDFNFDILRDGRFVIPIGNYNNPGYEVSLRLAPWRRVSGSLEHRRAGFWGGDRSQIEANLTLRPLIGVNITGNWSYNRVAFADGGFDAQIFRLLSSIDLTPLLSLNFNVQYDNVTRLLGVNNRLVWILQPGNNLFVVYNHNWQHFDAEGLLSLESRSSIKFAFTHRF
ncbi:MAG TPA: DUF5916 domain-containing protein [Saprospiraceae bacterium]|nr:DUF5916 domain-containing protein [Saprospiraceae bacterium]HMP25726.1 DUF5916 domain-containing protein [Saprospiraceae bacterium]